MYWCKWKELAVYQGDGRVFVYRRGLTAIKKKRIVRDIMRTLVGKKIDECPIYPHPKAVHPASLYSISSMKHDIK